MRLATIYIEESPANYCMFQEPLEKSPLLIMLLLSMLTLVLQLLRLLILLLLHLLIHH